MNLQHYGFTATADEDHINIKQDDGSGNIDYVGLHIDQFRAIAERVGGLSLNFGDWTTANIQH